MKKHSATKCKAKDPSTCPHHGSTTSAAVNRRDINAFIEAKQAEDNTNDMTDFFTTKQELRVNPPHTISVKAGDGWQILMDEEGNVFEKQYDEYGAGVGSRKLGPVGKLIYSKDIKKSVAKAWEQKDKDDAFKALPQWKQDKIKFEEAMEVYAPYMAAHDSEGASNARLEETQKALDAYLDANPSTNIKALRYAYYAGSQGMRAEHEKYGFTWLTNEVIAENNRIENEQMKAFYKSQDFNDSRR